MLQSEETQYLNYRCDFFFWMEEMTWSPQHTPLEVSSPVRSVLGRAGQGITPLMGAQHAGGSKPVIFRTVIGRKASEGWGCRRILTPLDVSRGCRRGGQEMGLLCAPLGRGTCCFPGLCWCTARCWSSLSEGSGGAGRIPSACCHC